MDFYLSVSRQSYYKAAFIQLKKELTVELDETSKFLLGDLGIKPKDKVELILGNIDYLASIPLLAIINGEEAATNICFGYADNFEKAKMLMQHHIEYVLEAEVVPNLRWFAISGRIPDSGDEDITNIYHARTVVDAIDSFTQDLYADEPNGSREDSFNEHGLDVYITCVVESTTVITKTFNK